jgi:riboflavin biosynthesis pyrimidine reductase
MVAAIKQVAIFSDNDSLARIIELNMSHYPNVQSTKLTSPSARPDSQISTENFDLVVLAIGRLATDPATMLARIAPSQARRVPLLIISSEPVRADWDGEVYTLSFPFSAYDLHRQIQEILNGETAAAPAQ